MADNWQAIALSKTNGHCAYCGKQLRHKSEWHMEHVVPKSAGGRKGIGNIVPACPRCNIAKGVRDPEQFRQHVPRKLISSLGPFSETLQWFDGLLPESTMAALWEYNARIVDLLEGIEVQFYAEALLQETVNGK